MHIVGGEVRIVPHPREAACFEVCTAFQEHPVLKAGDVCKSELNCTDVMCVEWFLLKQDVYGTEHYKVCLLLSFSLSFTQTHILSLSLCLLHSLSSYFYAVVFDQRLWTYEAYTWSRTALVYSVAIEYDTDHDKQT